METYIGEDEKEKLNEVITSQNLCRLEGKFSSQFEQQFSQYMGTRHALILNSGSAALHTALVSCGIKEGDEVITTAYSYIASSVCILQHHGIPVFADIDPRTFCLDPDDVKRKITSKTKAVIVVHIFGQPCRMDEFLDLCKKHNLILIEDCCQAYDTLFNGQKVGTIGDIGCFSLQQSKHITCGDGGILITNNDEFYDKAILFSNYGQYPDKAYKHHILGWNYRISELQAAVALAQLEKIQLFNQERENFKNMIETELQDVPELTLAFRNEKMKPNYWIYPLKLNRHYTKIGKDNLITEIKSLKCYIGGYIPRPNYMEPLYQNLDGNKFKKGLCPILETEIENLLTIGLHHGRDKDILYENLVKLKRALSGK